MVQLKNGRSKRILWVEDDAFEMQGCFEVLKDRGFYLETVNSANAALQILENSPEKFDLIILDVMMRRGKFLSEVETHGGYQAGVALGRLVRRKYPKVRIIGCSVVTDSSVVCWFSENADAFINKPCLPSEIADIVDAVLEGRPVRLMRNSYSARRIFKVTGSVLAILASIVSIFVYLTGKVSLKDFITFLRQWLP